MRPLVVMAVAVMLQPGCDPSAPTETEPAVTTATPRDRTSVQRVQATTEPWSGPNSCSPRRVGELVVDFFGAFNRGNVEISRFFAPGMEWYSVSEWSRKTGARHFVSYGFKPEELSSYFRRRAQLQERLHLLEIDADYEAARNLAHVAYVLRRTAEDLDDSHPIVIGKGAIDCETATIAVWSMSHDTRFQRIPSVCPGKRDAARVALACQRA